MSAISAWQNYNNDAKCPLATEMQDNSVMQEICMKRRGQDLGRHRAKHEAAPVALIRPRASPQTHGGDEQIKNV